MPVLMLIVCVVQRSTLHFAVVGSTVYLRNSWNKTQQVESLGHMEQYHLKFVKKITPFKTVLM